MRVLRKLVEVVLFVAFAISIGSCATGSAGNRGSSQAQSDQQEAGLCGEFEHLWDGDGQRAQDGSYIWLKLQNGLAEAVVAAPGNKKTGAGRYHVQADRITLEISALNIEVEDRPYSVTGNLVTLPFSMLGGKSGTSEWKSIKSCGAGDVGSSDGTGANARDGAEGRDGKDGAEGRDGKDGKDGGDGKSGGDGTSGKGGGDSTGGTLAPATSDLDELVGNWTGRAFGEETRFRDPNGLLILTVKHEAEFFFHLSADGKIEGEGTITYDMTQNTRGLDSLVAGVHALLGLMPAPGPPGTGASSGVAGKMGEMTTQVEGVTRTQYVAPHLKHGKELRQFKFTGHVSTDGGDRVTGAKLEQVGDYRLPGGKANNDLIAAWEVNKIKEESSFPCWSPFLEGAGGLRAGPGGIWVLEFQQQGTHREGKRAWQEYGYVWTAKRISGE